MLKAETQSFSTMAPLEAGSYPARLLSVIDLGLQPQPEWQGKVRPPARKLLTTYEILDEYLLDETGDEILDKPRVISEQFALHPLTSQRAKSTNRYFVLDPGNKYGGDWSHLVDMPVVVNIVQNPQESTGRIFNNIAGLSPMRQKEAVNARAAVNPVFVFDLDEPDIAVWEELLHDWQREIIKNNLNFSGSILEQKLEKHGVVEVKDDDNPW